MAVAAQITNNTTIRSILLAEKLTGSNFTNWYRNLRIVLRYEKKMKFVEHPIGPAPDPKTADPDTIDKYYETVNLEQEEDGQSVSSYLLQMKSYLDTSECLGYAMSNELGVSLILNSLNKDYDQFVQNYNMHSIRKMLVELHAMLKLMRKGFRESKKLKHGALSLYMGNGMRAAVEAIRSFDLIRSKDMHNLNPNVSSSYNDSIKRAKHGLDSYYLWHCHLGHINKKHMDMLQHDRLLQPTHDESYEKCMSCIFEKMERKPFPHQVERAKDLLGLIHTDGYALETAVCILNMVPTKKVDRTPYEIWHGKAPKLSYLRVWGYEFFENSFMVQEASGSHRLLKMSRSDKLGLEFNSRRRDTASKNLCKDTNEVLRPSRSSPKVLDFPIRSRLQRLPQQYQIDMGYMLIIEAACIRESITKSGIWVESSIMLKLLDEMALQEED
ncbi:retrotransposon protein, putative, ty1-copia subclass [Tanacetum coccineum]